MAGKLHHEEIYRGKDLLQKINAKAITVCGAGALGSNLVDNLARQGFQNLTVIDDDRVEEHNIGTQIYAYTDVGAKKVAVLQSRIFQVMRYQIKIVDKRLTADNNEKMIRYADLIVDTFDTTHSRSLVQEAYRTRPGVTQNLLHVGLYEDYGEAVWDEQYKVPKETPGVDVCDYPLARNIIMLTVTMASEVIMKFFLTGVKESYAITLKDLKISPRR